MKKTTRLAALAAMTALSPVAVAAASTAAQADTTLTIATVNNVQMIEMQKLSHVFEEQHPGIHLRWVVLEENVLRQRVTTDIATHGGQFDILTIGNYEVPIWAKQNWIASFDGLPAAYDESDLIGTVRDGVSYKGKIFALPFYAESAMTYYRTDLMKKAGITLSDTPTYDEFRAAADKMTDKSAGVYGVCLRGKPGWGENMAYVTTLVTAYGGQWFDSKWKPAIDYEAVARRDRLLRQHPQGRRTAGRDLERVQREPGAVLVGSLRVLDRRHVGGRHAV